jgi:AcrR family transcriptional regulator
MAVPAQAASAGADTVSGAGRDGLAGAGSDGAGGDGARQPWATLAAADKRARLLAAAETVFARDGVEATVPAIAAAAGAGVGSVYRTFASKDEIIEALAIERLRWVCELVGDALDAADAWAGFEDVLRTVAARQRRDGVLGEALAAAFDRPEVADAVTTTTSTMQSLLDRAREQGTLRAPFDATELRPLFAGLRAAEGVAAGAGERVLALVLAGLQA